MANGAHKFIDGTAPANCGHWRVGIAGPAPGLVIEALDDAGALYDRIFLRRNGAYIVVDREKADRPLPPLLKFLEPLVEVRARAQAVGEPIELPPVLVHTSRIESLFEYGYLPTITKAEHGCALILGVTVVWHRDLDRFAVVM